MRWGVLKGRGRLRGCVLNVESGGGWSSRCRGRRFCRGEGVFCLVRARGHGLSRGHDRVRGPCSARDHGHGLFRGDDRGLGHVHDHADLCVEHHGLVPDLPLDGWDDPFQSDGCGWNPQQLQLWPSPLSTKDDQHHDRHHGSDFWCGCDDDASDVNDVHFACPCLCRGDGISVMTPGTASGCGDHLLLMTVHRIYPLDGIVVFVHVFVRTRQYHHGRLASGIGDDGFLCGETDPWICFLIGMRI